MNYPKDRSVLKVRKKISEQNESDLGLSSAIFRVVIIPSAIIRPNINISNYTEVKEVYMLRISLLILLLKGYGFTVSF